MLEMLQTMEDMVDIPTEWINNLTAMCVVQVRKCLDARDLNRKAILIPNLPQCSACILPFHSPDVTFWWFPVLLWSTELPSFSDCITTSTKHKPLLNSHLFKCPILDMWYCCHLPSHLASTTHVLLNTPGLVSAIQP